MQVKIDEKRLIASFFVGLSWYKTASHDSDEKPFLYRQKGSAERNGLPLGEQVSKILGELISP
jgi:hypothetical protein